ncbi:hypothetical protein C0Q70_20966 [Pomacea canaliculata]|uniref:Serpin domain-containing protein n=1 Tax=Pomacea canaliculata TaxID=400727 RepID=A0A2T7NB72_POMCA|nr:hypothetical protein C0Q70_20966 [Pomacea canaliculata]
MIEVAEIGTKAAAVTFIGVGAGAPILPPPPEFKADHPFMFVLRDKVNGVNLFMGRVADPPRDHQ